MTTSESRYLILIDGNEFVVLDRALQVVLRNRVDFIDCGGKFHSVER